MKTPTPVDSPPTLSVSLVTYRSDPGLLRQTIESLLAAVVNARQAGQLGVVHLYLIQNDELAAPAQQMTSLISTLAREVEAHHVEVSSIVGHGNVGYGKGHNLSIRMAHSDFHLVLNPDVVLAADCLSQGLAFLGATPQAVVLSPSVTDGQGNRHHVCKRYPAVLDLLLRGFAPSLVQQWFAQRLARYELREPGDKAVLDISVAGGCFMLFRTHVLQALGGFDERYFLYFEDFDLSLRARTLGSLAYVPAMQITHHGGNAARKGPRHILMFMRSGVRFYNTHGWRLL